jgi:hypothetical protein
MRQGLGHVEIQVMLAEIRLSARPALTYPKARSAPIQTSTILVAARPSSIPARPDLNLNKP